MKNINREKNKGRILIIETIIQYWRMKIPKSTVYSMPTFMFMILFFGMGYFGHILYSNNFESIQARSIDGFR